MVQHSNMKLANELLLLRISLGEKYDKQEYMAAHLGVSVRQYTRMERHGLFTRKMVTRIRVKYPDFAINVYF